MIDYTMCCQTVTVYRKTREGIFRLEIPNCFLQWEEVASVNALGQWRERKFLLVQPGEQKVFAGDRIFDGVGPEIAPEEWDSFLPARIPGLGQAEYAKAYCWQGEICHTEAGRK